MQGGCHAFAALCKVVAARALPAAKACETRGNWLLSLHGEHAFAASMSQERDSPQEGRESMAPPSQPRANNLLTDRAPILLVALR